MELIALEAHVRDPKVSPLYLRKSRQVPGIFYGAGEENISLQMDYQTFRKVYMKAGSNQVVELNVDGKKKTVLIHDVQFNPLTDMFDHVDFKHVNMNKEITALIPIETIGISPAVKDLGGVLMTLKHELEVKCLPKDLPALLQVDISGLAELHSSIYVRDVSVPGNVVLTEDPESVVLTISAPRAEETTVPAAAAPAAATPAPAAEGAAKAA